MIPTRAPLPFDPEAGRRAVDACAPPDAWAEVVRGAGGSSPYLAGLLSREAAWLEGVWHADPDTTAAAIVRAAQQPASAADLGTVLRVAKRRTALLVALADLGGVWDTMQATAALTRFADAAVALALGQACGKRSDLPAEPGLVAMAMGKMGAGELNYSSDIDLVLLFDQGRYDPSDYPTARAALVKAARRAMALLSDVTAEGYVFRTDLRLRPDPASTPIVLSLEAAERYYEAVGRSWERAAWIKARACAGDRAAGDRLIAALRPFVWRRHLDFAAVEDAHGMRQAIRSSKALPARWAVPGHDLKLGQGGIREIEFFAQTRQLIAGGRDPALRVRGTLEALDRLAEADWVPRPEAETLACHYLTLRDAEHRVQMVQDAQTHRLPTDPDGLRRIACLAGMADADAFTRAVGTALSEVERIVDPFFRPAGPSRSADPPAQPHHDADLDVEVIARWSTYPALRSDRARQLFARLRPALLQGLGAARRPTEALTAFDGFLRGLPAGVQLFSLFEANPQLIDLIVDICATAPDLARYLAANSEVLDAVIGGAFLAPLPATFAPPAMPDDFEAALEALRLWHREVHFRIGVHLLRDLAPPDRAGRAYAALAEATLDAAWRVAIAETARRYGSVPGLRVAALGMGSLGAGRLTANSDLDLVVLHDGGRAGTDGPRALSGGQWAAKFTQVLITVLRAPTGAGKLYEVDMRLRPSGRQGPVATALTAFRSYQAKDAWVWEQMALTAARALVGDGDLCDRAEAIRVDVIAHSRFDATRIRSDLADMRARLARAERPGEGVSVKAGPGRMKDIALAAQAHALIAGVPARGVADQLGVAGWLPADARASLADAHRLMADVAQALALLNGDAAPAAEMGAGAAAVVARVAGQDDLAATAAACDVAAARAADAIGQALGRADG